MTVPPSGMATFIALDPASVHGRADFINEGADTATRVLLMQLVVNQGEHVQGTIGLVWDGAGAPDGEVASGLSLGFPSFTPPCPADTNDSGAVDVDDLVAIILGWGPCTTCPASGCASDIDNDDDTDVDDLVAVILGWDDCP